MSADLVSGPLKGQEFHSRQTGPNAGRRTVQTVTADAGDKLKAAIEAVAAR